MFCADYEFAYIRKEKMAVLKSARSLAMLAAPPRPVESSWCSGRSPVGIRGRLYFRSLTSAAVQPNDGVGISVAMPIMFATFAKGHQLRSAVHNHVRGFAQLDIPTSDSSPGDPFRIRSWRRLQSTARSRMSRCVSYRGGGGLGSQQREGGLIWDRAHWSCSYDSLLTHGAPTGLHGPPSSTTSKRLNPLLGLWANYMIKDETFPETPRDNLRTLLNYYDQTKFPTGPVSVKLDDLLMALTNRITYGRARTYCEICGYLANGFNDTLGMYLTTYRSPYMDRKYANGHTLSQWLSHYLDRLIPQKCPQCLTNGTSTNLRRRTHLLGIPALFIFGITQQNLHLDDEITFKTDAVDETVRLAGLIYHSEIGKHFTSGAIDKEKTIWYHDGITTRRECTQMGHFSSINPLSLHTHGEYKLAAAIYARSVV
ncbi:hypothetical protein B0H14DRAFT_2557050 [Mycena olivaceomarginata]|nr:hypothetical protein B0H14DRAFT_2557050 [Mycena olivaceomarginata]